MNLFDGNSNGFPEARSSPLLTAITTDISKCPIT